MERIINHAIPVTGYVEVLDHHGHVTQRIKIINQSVSIGRSLDNDIILDDPYVSSHHIRVVLQDRRFLIQDLNSVNGFFYDNEHHKNKSIDLTSNQIIRIGHTPLRFRHADQVLEKTLKDRHLFTASFWSFNRPSFIILVFVSLLALLALGALGSQAEEINTVKILAEIIPGVLLVFMWAGLWALFSKLMINKLAFTRHIGIFSVANVAGYLCTIILGYLFYAFGWDGLYTNVLILMIGAIACWMLFTHLKYSTKLSGQARLTAAFALAMIGAGFYLLDEHMLDSEFDYLPRYELILKSPDFNLVAGDSLEDFFHRTDSLIERVQTTTDDLTRQP